VHASDGQGDIALKRRRTLAHCNYCVKNLDTSSGNMPFVSSVVKMS
jgi:hypothetical protein